MLFKRVLSVLFALLMIFGMVSVSASAVSDGASGVSDKEPEYNYIEAVKADFYAFERIWFFIETKIFNNYKIGSERKLMYAAETGGNKWTLKNNINVRYYIPVPSSKGLKIDAKGFSITKTGTIFDMLFYITSGSSLCLHNACLNVQNGVGILNCGYTVLGGSSSIKSTDPDSICIKNEESGTLELFDVSCGKIFNKGSLEMPKGHFANVSGVISTEDSKIIMEAGHIGALTYCAEEITDILIITGGEIDKYEPLQPISFEWPLPSTVKTYISAPFGYINIGPETQVLNRGVNIAAAGGITGQPVLAAAAGEVIIAEYSEFFGNYVVIRHNDVYTTIYAHCSKLLVNEGEWVTGGQHIADAGSTGYVTGPHLYFAVKENGTFVDPMNYIKQP